MFKMFEKVHDTATILSVGAKNNPGAAFGFVLSAGALATGIAVKCKNGKEYEKYKQYMLNKNLSTAKSLDVDDSKADVNNDED